MSEVYLRRTATGLVAYDDEAVVALRRFKIDAIVRAELVLPRNLRNHRRFFAMLNVVWQACGDWPDVAALLKELKFRTGLVDTQRVVDHKTGEVLAEIITPQSIAFHNMGEEEFQAFTERAIEVICRDMVPGLESDTLREEVLRAL